MTDVSNVVAFEPRRLEPPPFVYCELRLRPNCTLQLNAVDERGGIVTYEFALAAPIAAADFERLVRAWDGWRNTATIAS